MEILIKRIAKKNSYTIGLFYVNNVKICDTIEDKDRGLTDNMSVEQIKKIKVYGETAIPTGTYSVTYTYSTRFKKYMPLINNVKGFDGIRIHSGNTAKDTLGCIIVGDNKVVGKVINSRVLCDKVYKLIKNALDKGEKVTLIIQ